MGDRDKAREEVETALSIDPDFLAARMLREQLNTPDTSAVREAAPAAPAPAASLAASAAKLADVEERVRARVRARTAVTPAVASPRPRGRVYRRGALAAAVVAFAAFALFGSRTDQPRLLVARGGVAFVPLVDAVAPEPLAVTPAVSAVDDEPEERPYMRPVVVPAVRPAPARPAPVRPAPVRPVSVTPPIAPPLPPPVATAPPPQVASANTVANDLPAPAVVPRGPDDRALVEEALGRYRRAYNRLDARSAQAVYPAVNAPALARAFDGLQSQSIEFDECNINVRGAAASVTCRGSSRYVPKIGSRDPRVEPRVWDFTLRKDAGSWKIENARAGR